MNALKNILAALLLISIYSNSFAQDQELLTELPKTKEEFVRTTVPGMYVLQFYNENKLFKSDTVQVN